MSSSSEPKQQQSNLYIFKDERREGDKGAKVVRVFLYRWGAISFRHLYYQHLGFREKLFKVKK